MSDTPINPMKSLIIAIALAFVAGCSSTPVADPLVVVSNGQRYVNVAVPINTLVVGDMIMFRHAGALLTAQIMAIRAPGVFRVSNFDLPVSESNYVGKLYPN